MADYIYANVIVDISHEKVDRPFQYRIPDRLIGRVDVGSPVNIPFGRGNNVRKGYVIELTDEPQWEVDKIKEILDVAEDTVSAEDLSMKLAAWMKRHYGSTMNAALRTVIPSGRLRSGRTVAMNDASSIRSGIQCVNMVLSRIKGSVMLISDSFALAFARSARC